MRIKKMLIFLLILAIVGVLFEGTLLFLVVRSESDHPAPEKADAAIVLGARVMPWGEPSTTLENRLIEALKLYEDGLVERVIVCGAKGADEPAYEADVMADYLIARGVPESAVYRERESTSTHENLAFAKVIMDEHGMKDAIVVTTDYHLKRAMWLASDLGIDATGKTALPPETPWVHWNLRFTETLSWVKYFLLRS